MTVPVIKSHLLESLRKLHLPLFVTHYAEQATLATNDGWSYDRYLLSLCELELNQRERKRIDKLLLASRLPRDKTISTFERNRLPRNLERQFASLAEGDFLDRTENVLIFGNPGSGKSHLLCALGHELVKKGRSVYFTNCQLLVQRLLRAKLELGLERELKRLDKYEGLIIDDIAYVQQSREEMEVLFTLLAYRYERRSLLLTSNLVFSEWEKIFKDPMTTAAAIDRVVHHSVIIELNLPQLREASSSREKRTGCYWYGRLNSDWTLQSG
jgi:DNA replication protein DnaC